MKMDKKIIQIMPAPHNLRSMYKDAEGIIEEKVICLGLTNEGEVVLMDICADGDIDEAKNACNFKGVCWK